jgi:hypothetical protein
LAAVDAAKKAAAKVTRANENKLATERAKVTEMEERAEHAESLLRSSQDQIEGLMKAQGR